MFLYVERFCDDVQHGHLSLNRSEQLFCGWEGNKSDQEAWLKAEAEFEKKRQAVGKASAENDAICLEFRVPVVWVNSSHASSRISLALEG